MSPRALALSGSLLIAARGDRGDKEPDTAPRGEDRTALAGPLKYKVN